LGFQTQGKRERASERNKGKEKKRRGRETHAGTMKKFYKKEVQRGRDARKGD